MKYNKELNLQYIYDTPWRKAYKEFWNNTYHIEPSIQTVFNGVILPSVDDGTLSWGIGGVIDQEGNLVSSSIDIGAFGGKYKHNKNQEKYIDETIIYLGILPLHWGHFLVNFISRLWILNENELYKSYKLAYIPRYNDGLISGQFKECIECLGLDISSMLRIEHPTKVKQLIIPENAMHWGKTFSAIKYRQIIDLLKEQAIKRSKSLCLHPYEKVYFTRRHFTSRDIGEAEIESNFKKNGFTVLAPETLSFIEQVFYIHNAKEIAAIGGTITHNYMFATENSKLIILNRFPRINEYQFRINYTFNLNITWIDVYNHRQLNKNITYGDHHIWVEVSKQLKQFFVDNNMLYDSFIFQKYIGNVWAYYKLWIITPWYWNMRALMGKLKKRLCPT